MLIRRIAAVFIAAGTFVVAGCDSSSPPPPSATTPAVGLPDCLVQAFGRTGVDIAFDGLVPVASEQICPADIDSVLAEDTAQFHELNAGEVSEDGQPVMRVLVGQLESGSGEAFVDDFLTRVNDRAAQQNPPGAVASEPQEIGDRPVTYFNIPGDTDGYAHADGQIVVIAYTIAAQADPKAERDMLQRILLNVHSRDDLVVDTYPLGQGNYTVPDDPGWIFFRGPSGGSCGIGPNGDIAGCDSAPEAPEGMNETVVTPGGPAHYRHSDTTTFVRDVDRLPEGHRLQNGDTRCAVGYQGTVHCETAGGEHGFVVAHYAVLW
jgi:hypothetical protein